MIHSRYLLCQQCDSASSGCLNLHLIKSSSSSSSSCLLSSRPSVSSPAPIGGWGLPEEEINGTTLSFTAIKTPRRALQLFLEAVSKWICRSFVEIRLNLVVMWCHSVKRDKAPSALLSHFVFSLPSAGCHHLHTPRYFLLPGFSPPWCYSIFLSL